MGMNAKEKALEAESQMERTAPILRYKLQLPNTNAMGGAWHAQIYPVHHAPGRGSIRIPQGVEPARDFDAG